MSTTRAAAPAPAATVSGFSALRQALADLEQLPSYDEAPELYRDWGETEDFAVKVGKGECAQ